MWVGAKSSGSSKWSDIPKSNFVMTFAGRLRRAPLTECSKNEICFTWVPNSGPKILFFIQSRYIFFTQLISDWSRSKPVMAQSRDGPCEKKIDFHRKIFFWSTIRYSSKTYFILKHSVRGALRSRPANVITKLLLGISDHFDIHKWVPTFCTNSCTSKSSVYGMNDLCACTWTERRRSCTLDRRRIFCSSWIGRSVWRTLPFLYGFLAGSKRCRLIPFCLSLIAVYLHDFVTVSSFAYL